MQVPTTNLSMLACQLALGNDISDPGLSRKITEHGNTSLRRKNYRRAVQHFRHAISLDQRNATAYAGIGDVYLVFAALDKAIPWYERSIALDATDEIAHFNFSTALLAGGFPERALEEANIGISLDPNSVLGHLCMANIKHFLGDLAASKQHYEAGIRLEPDNHDALVGLGCILLSSGKLQAGWDLYEHRLWPQRSLDSGKSLPRWEGQSLTGKTLLVIGEQGLGDIIQFSRFIKKAAAHGGRIVFEAPPDLHRLLEDLAGVDALTVPENIAFADFQIPLMSLPRVLKVYEEAQLRSEPYITCARPQCALATYASEDPRTFNIGIAWGGDSRTHGDRVRSIPLSTLAPIAALEGVRLRSLQTGESHLSELKTLTARDFAVAHDDVQISDLTTCAAIYDMDLVISVDTSIAHLSGAHGKPTWVMLSYSSDWRWGQRRSDTPWYGQMRLFRQDAPGDWASVVKKIVAALQVPILSEMRSRRMRTAAQAQHP
jgi:Tfp pilus assembly protein PilF